MTRSGVSKRIRVIRGYASPAECRQLFRYTAMMRGFLSSRPLRLLFAANLVSMFGSGMNTAAVNWYILQATHSERLLGFLVVAQALPSLFLMPFSGVIVDRDDRRHVVMFLDASRALLILGV